MNTCFDIIGIKGLCPGKTYTHYLDDHGFSLQSMAKVTDERFKNGAEMLQSILDRAWADTLLEITFNGVDSSKILSENEIGEFTTETFTGTVELPFKVSKTCKLVQFLFQKVVLKAVTGGDLKVELINSDETDVLYDGEIEDGKQISISKIKWTNDFSIRVTTTAVLLKTNITSECGCNHNYVSVPSDISPIKIEFLVRCNKEKYLCRFADIIAPAVIHKALGLAWYEVFTTNRFSEFQLFKKEEAPAQMLFHDSNYKNLLEGESVRYTKGQYQKKMELITASIPAPKCNCCNECKKSITIKNEMP